MIQSILNILNGIGEFFTSIGNIITSIFEGMVKIPQYVSFAINYTTGIINWFFPVVISVPLILIICIVAIYKIFGRE